MTDFLLSCCSTADLSDEFFDSIRVPYICFHYTIDGETYPDDLGKSMPLSDFYGRIKNGSFPTTSQVNVNQYLEFFEPHLKDGRDVLHVTLSSGISGSYNSACVAREELAAKYPKQKVYIIDSLAASSGYGLLMYLAAQMRDDGKSIDEIHSWIENNKLHIHHWVCVSDLSHLKRGGRISSASAIAGTILNICPLIDVNSEGKLIQRRKIRGKKQIIQEMLKTMQTHANGGADYDGPCFISHAACKEDADTLAGLICESFKNIDGGVRIFDIGTVIGSHTGPGTFALFFVGTLRGV